MSNMKTSNVYLHSASVGVTLLIVNLSHTSAKEHKDPILNIPKYAKKKLPAGRHHVDVNAVTVWEAKYRHKSHVLAVVLGTNPTKVLTDEKSNSATISKVITDKVCHTADNVNSHRPSTIDRGRKFDHTRETSNLNAKDETVNCATN